MSTTPHLEALRKAAAARQISRDDGAKVTDAAYEHDRRTSATAADLQTQRSLQNSHAMATALGEDPTGRAPDFAEIARLEGEMAAHDRVKPIFKARSLEAKAKIAIAEKAFNVAAQEYVVRERIDPARVRLDAALDELRAAAVELMGAHHAAYVKFEIRDGHWNSIDDFYGPAATLVRALSELTTWREWPYSLRPNWLPRHGPILSPRDLAGVSETTRDVLAAVEEAAQ